MLHARHISSPYGVDFIAEPLRITQPTLPCKSQQLVRIMPFTVAGQLLVSMRHWGATMTRRPGCCILRANALLGALGLPYESTRSRM